MLKATQRAVALYRSHPYYLAPRDFVASIRALIENTNLA